MMSSIPKYAKFLVAALTAVVAVLPATSPTGSFDWRQFAISAIGAVLVLIVPNKVPSARRPVPGDGKAAYEAYGTATNHRNFLGEPMPQWDDLPTEIRSAWRAAAGSLDV